MELTGTNKKPGFAKLKSYLSHCLLPQLSSNILEMFTKTLRFVPLFFSCFSVLLQLCCLIYPIFDSVKELKFRNEMLHCSLEFRIFNIYSHSFEFLDSGMSLYQQ